MGENTKNYSLATMPLASAFRPTCNISPALAPLSRKNWLNQGIEHFFIEKSKTCHKTVEFRSQRRQNTKNYSWATMPIKSAFRPTCNISSALAPLSRKNSLNQHFFTQKSKTCHETVEFTSKWWKNTKNYSCVTMPHVSAFRPTWNISSALAPLSIKNSLSRHFFIQRSNTCHETVEFTSKWGGKHQKQLLRKNALRKCLQAHMQHFFSPSPAIDKKFADSAFFHTKIKYLSWNRWIYEQMGGKHQKQLLRKNALRKCLQAHTQHFFSPSPAIEKKFVESAFFHTKIKNLSWNRWICEPMVVKQQNLLLGDNAPGKCLHGHMQHFFRPSPAIENKFADSAFFPYKNQKLAMKPLNLRANGGKTPKTAPAQQCHRQVPPHPHATFLPP